MRFLKALIKIAYHNNKLLKSHQQGQNQSMHTHSPTHLKAGVRASETNAVVRSIFSEATTEKALLWIVVSNGESTWSEASYGDLHIWAHSDGSWEFEFCLKADKLLGKLF